MSFHQKLKYKMHCYVKYVYKVTRNFPKDEIYGVTTQLRRSSMSIILNYIEGYARRTGAGCRTYKNFLDISYGSLKESKYLIYFSYTENYLSDMDYKNLVKLNDEIGRMVWSVISKNS